MLPVNISLEPRACIKNVWYSVQQSVLSDRFNYPRWLYLYCQTFCSTVCCKKTWTATTTMT